MPAEDFFGADLGSALTLSSAVIKSDRLTPVVRALTVVSSTPFSHLALEGDNTPRGAASKVIEVYEGNGIPSISTSPGQATLGSVELLGNKSMTATSVVKLFAPAAEAAPETVFQIWG